jgi:multisubunit Na+/H+ antiporter MnhB subunit
VNLFSLSILSRAMENYLGVWKFLLILFGSVIGGSIFLFCTAGNTVGVGLSGGLYGLLAGYVFTIYEAGGMKIPQVRTGVMQTIVINLFINFMPGVAWQAHLGGAITGLLLLMAFQPRRSDKKALLHARIALVLLLIGSGFAMVKKSAIPEGERYLLTDLREVLDAETLAKCADRLYYIDETIIDVLNSPLGEQVEPNVLEYPQDPKKPETMQKPVPVGIDVSDREDLQKAYYLDDTLFVGIIKSTARPELSRQFLEYLLQ